MDHHVNAEFEHVLAAARELLERARIEVITVWLPIQLGLIALAAGIGYAAAVAARRRFDPFAVSVKWPPMARQLVKTVADDLGLIVFILIASVLRASLLGMLPPSRSYLLSVSVSLATAWVVISILAALIRNQFVNRVVAITAWTIAALSILGLLDPTMEWLDSVAIVAGGLRISLLLVLETCGLLLLALWGAVVAGNFLDRQLRRSTELTPSIQVLIGKLIRLTLVTLAIAIVLSSVGIDLSALALFSGAVGVGVGFGLQKVVSNLVSGIILLADKSIKPGDVISVGDSFGWIGTMGARYTSVVTRDGREVLIPNEDLVTQRVINWSYSDDRVRLDVPFGVAYDSDPHLVRKVAAEAALSVARVLALPPPICHLVKFNDSSLDFLLRFWIKDPIGGITNVSGEVMLALWDAFKREGINIPYPVRDLRFGDGARVTVARTEPVPEKA